MSGESHKCRRKRGAALPHHRNGESVVDDTDVLREAIDDRAERDEVEPSERSIDDSNEELAEKRARG